MFDLMFRTQFIELAKDLSPFFVSLLTFVTVFVFVSIFIRDSKAFIYNLVISMSLTITAYFGMIFLCDLARMDYFLDFFRLFYLTAKEPLKHLLSTTSIEIYRLALITSQSKTALHALYLQAVLLLAVCGDTKLYFSWIRVYFILTFDEVLSSLKNIVFRVNELTHVINKDIKTLNCVYNC